MVCYDADSVEERFRIETASVRSNCLAVSPDGKTLATGSNDGTIRFWDVRTGKAINVLSPGAGAGGIGTLAFSADGNTLAAGMGASIRLWDVASGKELLERPPISPCATAGFSLHGQEVISLQAGALTRWSARTGKVVQQFKLTGGAILGAALSADRKLIAVSRDDGPICVLDAQTGAERVRLPFTSKVEIALVFTPDGRRLIGLGAEEPNVIRTWDCRTGKDVITFKRDSRDTRFGLAMSRDGRTLYSVGHADKQLLRWEMSSGQLRGKYLMPDPQSSAGNPYGDIIIWRGGRFHRSRASRLPFALSADDRLLAICRGELLLVCDLLKERVLHVLIGRGQSFSSVAFSPDGRLLAAGADDRHVRLWDLRTGKLRATLAGHRAEIHQVDFSTASDRLLSSSSDGTMLVWDVAEALRVPDRETRAAAPRSLAALWNDLASEDAAVADKALRALENQSAQAVTFLARNLRPAVPVEQDRLARLIADLDSNEVSTRDQATAQLNEIGEQAVPALRKANESASLEVRRRAQRLLDRLDRQVVTGPSARPVRAVELLERIGSAEARKLISELAGGAAQARQTQEAQASLKRLRGREDKTVP
jgi:WD40 repeat protein